MMMNKVDYEVNVDSGSEGDARQGKQFDMVGTDTSISPAVPLKSVAAPRKRSTVTRKQEAANRQNAMRSSGPRTLAGKEVSSRNALKHGLTSTSVLLPGDDTEEFRRFESGYKLYWSPQGQHEEALVQLITAGMWALLRLQRIEAGALSYIVNAANDPADMAQVVLELLARYGTTKGRAVSQWIRDLERLQDRRRREECLPAHQRLTRLKERKRTMMALIAQYSPATTPDK